MEIEAKKPQLPPSLEYLTRGYLRYASHIIKDRSVIGLDGLKPSQRRLLYAMYEFEKMKPGILTKSASVIGAALKIHPHGDSSLYKTLVRMAQKAGYMGVAFLEGNGDFGAIHTSEEAAAMRYTEVELLPISMELFKDMAGADMIPSEDEHYMEPELLPVRFPFYLTNDSSGIAVGLSSFFIPFNFHDVGNSTIELIETGDIQKPLIPDFPTKGEYVYNEKELTKIMETGKGRVKVRGKWHIEGKDIVITELPFHANPQKLIKDMREVKGVSRVVDGYDLHGMNITIYCSSKKVVDEVLKEALRLTDLQTVVTANMTVIVDNRPMMIGVKDSLREWVKFRKRILGKKLTAEYESTMVEEKRYTLYVDFMSDAERVNMLVNALLKGTVEDGKALMRSWYPEGEESVFDWILGMSLRTLSARKDRSSKLESIRNALQQLKEDLDNIEGVIVREIKEILGKYSYPRQTEVTEFDYEFDKSDIPVVKSAPTNIKVEVNGKFIRVLKDTHHNVDIEGISCSTDNILSFIDSQGRILRLALNNVPIVTKNEKGFYLPVHLDIEDDFDVIAHELIEDKKVGYVYEDGYASVVDYSEWVNMSKVTRMTVKGVSPKASLIVGETDINKPYTFVMTTSGRFCFIENTFKQKHRTARTKVLTLRKDEKVKLSIAVSLHELLKVSPQAMDYLRELSHLKEGDTLDTDYLKTLA